MRSSTLSLLLLAFWLTFGAGCSQRANRCWVRPDRHEQAQRLYDRTGSIELTEQTLREAGWQTCEISQTIYRLRNENSL